MEITAAAAQATTYTTGKTLAEQINDYLAVSKTSIATLASEIPGYSRPTISRYLSGKYEGDISTIEKLLADWLAQRTGEAVALPEPGRKTGRKPVFYESRDALKVLGVCQSCQEYIGLGIVVARSGYGKTYSLRQYAKLPRVAYIECDDTMSSRDLVEAIEKSLGIPSGYGTIESYRTRLSMKGVISEAGGIKSGILYALASLGYEQSTIEPFSYQDPERWAEFIVFLKGSKQSGVNNLAVIDAEVRKVKEGSSKPSYGAESGGVIEIHSETISGFSRYPRCGEIVCGVWPHVVSIGHLLSSEVQAVSTHDSGEVEFPKVGTIAASEKFYQPCAFVMYEALSSEIEAGSAFDHGAKIYPVCSPGLRCSGVTLMTEGGEKHAEDDHITRD